MSYSELSDEQRRIYVDAIQTYQALEEARSHAFHYKGYMTWKKARGREYLFKGRPGARGTGQSLGRRSSATEKQYEAFYAGKEEATARVEALEEQVALKGKYALANRLNRIPRAASQVCRALNATNCKFVIVGSNALYGYEVLAGIHFHSEVIATEDLDVLLDTREQLRISIEGDSPRFIELLKKADKSFQISDRQKSRAINNKGYMVDLITAPKNPPHLVNEFARTLEGDLDIAEIEKLEWLISAPRVECYPIAFDGIPVRVTVPDPRAFAVHKYFVSKQANREPVKRRRDESQAKLVIDVVNKYLPAFSFSDQALRSFPVQLRQQFLKVNSAGEDERLW
ncbi:MAG: hypothetical protein HOE54_12765 [Gammaproteobacteria bacterium]|nr:hypothetical protein [Gammaproteobacteria bacterium]